MANDGSLSGHRSPEVDQRGRSYSGSSQNSSQSLNRSHQDLRLEIPSPRHDGNSTSDTSPMSPLTPRSADTSGARLTPSRSQSYSFAGRYPGFDEPGNGCVTEAMARTSVAEVSACRQSCGDIDTETRTHPIRPW
jgi:hypothetical protein